MTPPDAADHPKPDAVITGHEAPADERGELGEALGDEAEWALAAGEANVIPDDAAQLFAKPGDEFRLKPGPGLEPDDHLRISILWMLFALVVFSIFMIALGMACKWFDSDFGKSILQVVVGPVIGALAAVVGYLFAERKKG
ncbi:hypothetical protein VSH64_37080 [Amycolatopsis rhabdoformis]|uniref:Uncharacterized protein n=1 Tax=Amycolatopsis rhabdoformis TaxID=1448059 RepID=A0ABZ1I1Z2_9PSEU|nr:hypothetical protein [Amycolatopsis rhabdoformis]WSE28410.1 hypothetical protein VSH64_37080 [Amycolatopsis rhabdoformis]